MKKLISVFAILFAAALSTLDAQVPNLISYQGKVAVGNTNFNGTGQFKFALVNGIGSSTYWSNDGTSTAGSQPSAAVSLPVSYGLFSVRLGDTTFTNMTTVPTSVFANADVRVRIWFNDGSRGFQLLSPDSRLTPNGYLPDGVVIGGTTTVGANILLPATNSAGTAGVIVQSGTSLLHTYGVQNFFAGASAGNYSMTAGNNVAIGYQAFCKNTNGNTNVAVGSFALTNNTSGIENSANGVSSLYSNTTGIRNVAVGKFALYFNTVGNNNIAVGYQSGLNLTGNNNIDIGSVGVAGESGIIRIGDGAYQTDTYLTGTVRASNIVAPSDIRYKTDVRTIDHALSQVCRIRGVTYSMRRDEHPHMGFDTRKHYGVIAQELREVLPDAVIEDNKHYLGVSYMEMIPLLIEAVKEEHQAQLSTQAENAQLKARIAELEAKEHERGEEQQRIDERLRRVEQALMGTALESVLGRAIATSLQETTLPSQQ